MARALLAAAAIVEDGSLDRLRDERYAGWDTELGRSIASGTATLADLHERAFHTPEPRRASGRQEALENLVARYVERAR
jgi:xylose isomerase